MAEYTLTSAPPLAGTDITIGDARLAAPADLAIVAIALPLGGEKAALAAIKKGYGVDLPEPGKSVEADGATLLRLAPDQAFVLFTRAEPDAEAVVAAKLGDTVYLTDQTDAWCALDLSGSASRSVLERICQVDLHPGSFAVGDLARTVMEHLGSIVLRQDDDNYRLLSMSSSANSFLHAVETSMKNIT